MADAESPDEPSLFTCTRHLDEPERAAVRFAAASTAVEAVPSGKPIARGR